MWRLSWGGFAENLIVPKLCLTRNNGLKSGVKSQKKLMRIKSVLLIIFLVLIYNSVYAEDQFVNTGTSERSIATIDTASLVENYYVVVCT